MLIQYFTRPSRIDELRNCPGGRLLEDFAKELAAARYQWVAASVEERDLIPAVDRRSAASCMWSAETPCRFVEDHGN
jgi:hypothetical protein